MKNCLNTFDNTIIIYFLGTGGTSTGGAVCLYVCVTKRIQKKSMQPLPGARLAQGSPVQVYRSENHFGQSELRVLMGVLATQAQSVKGGPRYTQHSGTSHEHVMSKFLL